MSGSTSRSKLSGIPTVLGTSRHAPTSDMFRTVQSITDACIGWETTVEVLEGLADAVRARRGMGAG